MKISKTLLTKSLSIAASVVFAAGLLFSMSSCQSGTEEIKLGYVLWDSEIASTHVVAAVIQDDLGYEVDLTSVDAGPMWMGVARGDFDAMVAGWLPVTHEAYLEETKDDVINLGANLEGARLGLVVPEYVPVNSIEELNDHVDEFDGEIIGIDPGAGLMAATERTIEEYDLDYELVSGSDAAMTAALERAIDREEWIIVTGWTPHWKFAAHDLKYLEDPKKTLGEAEHIATIVHPDLQEKAPDVYTFLDNFYWTPEEMAEVMILIEEGMEPMEAARTWIAENRDRVDQWLP
ncbi:MAG: glycine betaine ABC transporter substrate-binding protein [Bacteroidales bacterium]